MVSVGSLYARTWTSNAIAFKSAPTPVVMLFLNPEPSVLMEKTSLHEGAPAIDGPSAAVEAPPMFVLHVGGTPPNADLGTYDPVLSERYARNAYGSLWFDV